MENNVLNTQKSIDDLRSYVKMEYERFIKHVKEINTDFIRD